MLTKGRRWRNSAGPEGLDVGKDNEKKEKGNFFRDETGWGGNRREQGRILVKSTSDGRARRRTEDSSGRKREEG